MHTEKLDGENNCLSQWGVFARLFSRRGTRRKSEDPDDVEEREERRKEQTDEIRLKHTNLYSYNPLSKKYKARKEELLRNLKREF